MTVRRTASGKHEAVQAFRKKMDSVREGTLEELLELNRQLDVELEIEGVPKDPRRDGDSLPPTDRIEFPTIPAPPKKKDDRNE
jgi:hypothetical protein